MAKRLGWYRPEQMILKVTLIGSSPAIWRRVEVHSGLTLEELHYVIQCLFMWDNSHLYDFLVPPGGKLTRAAMRDAKRITMPPNPFFDGEDDSDGRVDEIMLSHVFADDIKQIVYEYDFGDSWHHLVKLEKRTPGGDPEAVPVCLAGENAAPLDDTGGVYGFYSLRDAWLDKANPNHHDAAEWFGNYDPTALFDLACANERLAHAFKPVAKPRKKPRKRKDESG